MQETNFDDWPLDGVRSVRTVVKDLRRANKSFMDSHFDWARSSGVRPADRAVHEHRTLSNILELMQSYDQLSIVNLASAESTLKRRVLIEHGCSGRPENPRYDGAEQFMGLRDTEKGEVVDRQAVRHQAQKRKDEGQVLKERRLKLEEDNAMRPAAAGPKK